MLKSSTTKNITSKPFVDESVTQVESKTNSSTLKSFIEDKSTIKYILKISFILRERLIYYVNNEDK